MDLASPAKLVGTVQANAFSFEQVLSDKLYSTLVIKPVALKMVLHVTGSLMLTYPRESTHHSTSDKHLI
jgi:hypothetical protein